MPGKTTLPFEVKQLLLFLIQKRLVKCLQIVGLEWRALDGTNLAVDAKSRGETADEMDVARVMGSSALQYFFESPHVVRPLANFAESGPRCARTASVGVRDR